MNKKPQKARCPVCRRTTTVTPAKAQIGFNCPMCGEFAVSADAVDALRKGLNAHPRSRQTTSRAIRQNQYVLIDRPLARRLTNYTTRRSGGPLPLLRYLSSSKVTRGAPVLHDLDTWGAISDVDSPADFLSLLNELSSSQLVLVVRQTAKEATLQLTKAGQAWIEDRTKSSAKNGGPQVGHSNTALYISAIELEGTKSFGTRQRIEFTDQSGRLSQWTVLLGDNGTGKTTVLQWIAALFPVASRTRREQAVQLALVDKSVADLELARRHPTSLASANLLCSEAGLRVEALPTVQYAADAGRNVSTLVMERLIEWETISLTSTVGTKFTYSAGAAHNFPSQPSLLVAYGAARIPGTSARLASDANAVRTLFVTGSPLRSVEEWLLSADYAARFERRSGSNSQRRLARIKRALLTILPDVAGIVFLPPTEAEPNPRVRFRTTYGTVPFGALSLGYQTTLAWVVDLAARMFEHSPNSVDPLAEPAVVLVDEIDLHLHPKWQREIMSFLGRIFPRCQFVVTTHSPLIVQGNADVNLALLRRNGDEVQVLNDVDELRSWRADQLLTSDLFDLKSARPTYVQSMLDERRRLVTKPDLSPRERKRLEEINAEVDNLPVAETVQEERAMNLILRVAKRLEGQ